ncbi:glycoside hydrolase [Aureobasidium pullulans]|uniref:cellulase n=1 Tax=Aureobasidium pullulans TaxID=5580 RepID=A0A4S9MIL4_AURPU|nr:glycoside hydrolase [Aureobasidium pullulans]THZ68915.1 glycoside hydrolase [Aureobasidium pullulans]
MHLPSLLLAAGSASVVLSQPLTRLSQRASKLQFVGINESGPEFGEANIPGTYGTDYTWPDLSTISTFVNKGMNTFRVNFLMERLVPNEMTGSLDAAYLGNLTETVNGITKLGAYAIIVPHNYGRYNGEIITSTEDFAAFWKTVAAEYKDNDKVIFDTNNEFHDESSTLVAQLNQAAITAIRSAGAISQYITVEGNAYTGAWTWTTTQGTDGKTNGETMGSLTDTVEDKLIYQMHQYLDSDGSGTSPTCVSQTIGSERLQAATTWLRDNKKIGLVGEFAGAVNTDCEAAVKDLLAFVAENSDVWTGALWWAAGPWWGDYMFSVEPKDGVAYSTYADVVASYA